MTAIRRFFLRLFTFFRGRKAEEDLAREIHAHLQLLEDKFLAQGMNAEEARYAARRAFGGVEQAKERQRDARGFRWLDVSWLDFKLGFRMLVRYPGLTIVGGLAMWFAIAVGAGGFEFLTQLTRPTLPLDEGDRIVGIRLWHTASASVEEQALFDFARWRGALQSVEDLGAFRTLERNLATDDGPGRPARVAEISASAFRLARVPPLHGRFLVDADEQAAAPPVVVIGFDEWQTRFGGRADVVGQTVRLGSTHATVVGVMPNGFAFPVRHSVWTPLRLDVLEQRRRQGPEIYVFGRLAPGVTRERAQVELTAIGLRTAAEFPDTHEHLRPEVLPYAQSIVGVSGPVYLGLMSINVFLVTLVVLVSGNVALLMFARAATRERELAVRAALGATRGRIVTQFFAEALVLGGVAAVAGLAAARFLLEWWLRASEIDTGGQRPFWFHDSLGPVTVLYAVGLTVLAAVVAGVVPALKVTGRNVEACLRQATAGGGGLRFGGAWTAVIVSQVAVTVAFPASAFFVRRHVVEVQSLDVGFPAAEYLSARLEVDREVLRDATSVNASQAQLTARLSSACDELARRIAAEPGVIGVTFTDRLPRTVHPHRWIEVEGDEAARPESALGHRVNAASVGVDYFAVLGAPVLAGRAFRSGDLGNGPGTVIVNQSFVQRILGGRNAIGRRTRYVTRDRDTGEIDPEREPWHEIVGVVPDLGTIRDNPRDLAGLYHPAAPGAALPVHIAVHLRGVPQSFAPRLRMVAAAVDPTLQLHDLASLSDVGGSLWNEFDFLFRLLAVVSAMALLLSLAGIYAVMSFTVSQRTREIGVRIALGASAGRVVVAIFARPLAQVGVGIVVGGAMVAGLTYLVTGLSAWEGAIVVVYMALMMCVCLLACVVPTRRALRVQPSEALRADG